MPLRQLAALAAFSLLFAAPAHADPLVDAVQQLNAVGVRTRLGDYPRCTQNPTLLGYYHFGSRTITVCESNHQGDDREMGDTFKHEAIHAVQHCNGHKPLMGSNTSWLFPQLEQLGYPDEELHTEAEARVLASIPYEGLTRLVRAYCLG